MTATTDGAEMSSALYPTLLGSSWPNVAEAIRHVHGARPGARARGQLRVTNGPGPVARVVARILRLPQPGDAVDTRLVVNAEARDERWLRTIGGCSLDTQQYLADNGELAERYGILEFRFRLDLEYGGIVFRQVGAAVCAGPFRVQLPARAAPRIIAREEPAGEREVDVHVRVELPLFGPVLTYDGRIAVEAAA